MADVKIDPTETVKWIVFGAIAVALILVGEAGLLLPLAMLALFIL